MSKKQFTLDSWLKDKSQKVVTRCGFPVRIVCTDVKRKDYPILALVERDDQEEYQSFTKDGRFSLYNPLHDNFDLFIETADEVSEDEKILEIIKHCIESRYLHTSTIKGISQKQCLAWLEKQGEKDILEDAILDGYILDGNEDGLIAETIRYKKEKQAEQNQTDKVKPKFKVGDKIRRKTPSSFDKDMQVARIEKDYYVCNHIGKFSSEVVPFSKQSSYELIEQKPAWSDEDECYMSECIGAIATKDGWSFDEKRKTKHWLKSLKDRVLLQPKQKWSEEEIEKAAQEWESKANFNPFYMTMENGKPTGVKQHITTHKESFIAGVNWILKSLNS